MALDRPLEVLTVCGVGMGSSLMLKMTAEEALRGLGVDATVECTDVSTARGRRPDVVIGQEMHTSELTDLAPVVVAVSDFLDSAALRTTLSAELAARGWLP
ncbi:PTS system, ascorbate-specific IIB component [Amycolatopsis arida]|uniref:PTS system, ascorbate-specific IIB component n=1 Tax=Amycolatopsis arida TaxID=587909 RepID=A0A1I5SDY8_9PSEU|nr:PTS sugar transporter subunit IIB [Amycolatopsis arida]TDX96507.1 PTS system ascorbate-specific IIB component [Amycolatopsis arida]SFP68929.1 PTS system, ascorbate-specific IIB component [Amycolatopsis arida]